MENFIIRKLEPHDYHKGYLDILSELSTIDKNHFSENKFDIFLEELPKNQHLFVIHETHSDKVVGCGSIIIETKIIHNFGKVGHIEDIVIGSSHRKFGLGKKIVQYLIDYAKLNDCYKVILNCSDDNIEFYKKNGFNKKDNSMAIYF